MKKIKILYCIDSLDGAGGRERVLINKANYFSQKDNYDVSIITTKLQISDIPEGTIALIGPKRMDYDKALSSLEFLIKQLQEYYKKEG